MSAARHPLPPDIFDQVNATHAVVFLPQGRCVVVSREPRTGAVARASAAALDVKCLPQGQRRIRARWLADPRRRELRLSVSAVPCRLTDAEWEGR